MKYFLLCLLISISTIGTSQQDFWSVTKASQPDAESLMLRRSNPVNFDLYHLSINDLQNTLKPLTAQKSKVMTLKFPMPNGSKETFTVKEHSVFQEGLQAKHPNLRSYKGVSTKDAATIIYFTISPYKGFNAMITSGRFGTFFIDAFTKDKQTYIAYQKDELPAPSENFKCEVLGSENFEKTIAASPTKNANDGILRTYRLALACTGEYAQFHLNAAGIPITDITTPDSVKKEIVLEEMMLSMARVNGIYERDVAIRMVIVDNNEEVIFLNFVTDPYTNEDGVSMLFTNQVACDMNIGAANYDIGHVYSTGGGGVAFLGVPCSTQKAGGVTGLPMPTGDPFWVDFVAHEMGHQFGANHTQNNNCQRNGATAMEPGSASTILGYAGICSPNVQQNSDAHFHAISIDEMWNYINTQSCEVQVVCNNVAPIAIAPQDFTIPASTPFELIAIATDEDGDALTYCWEQIDNEIGPVMPPAPTNAVGPMFRSNPPIASSSRFMPNMETVLAGETQNTWEVVPSVNRTMEFRVTVRDNSPDCGNTASDDVVVTVAQDAGPFAITTQNEPTSWTADSFQTISWSVNNTNVAPINATNVNILFSSDGGQTFATTLATNIANDGQADIIVPNISTTTGRVKIVPTNNAFFDVNDADITIDQVLAVEETESFKNLRIFPNPSQGTVNIAFSPTTNEEISISLYDIRGRKIKTTSFDNLGVFNQALDYRGTTQGIYFVKVTEGKRSITKKVVIQ